MIKVESTVTIKDESINRVAEGEIELTFRQRVELFFCGKIKFRLEPLWYRKND